MQFRLSLLFFSAIESDKRYAKRHSKLSELIQLHIDAAHLFADNANCEKAILELEDALELYNDHSGEVSIKLILQINLKLSEVMINQQQFDDALDYAKRYLENAEECENLVEKHKAHVTLGRIYLEGDISLNSALEHFKLSHDLLSKISENVTPVEYNEMLARVEINLCTFNILYCKLFYEIQVIIKVISRGGNRLV